MNKTEKLNLIRETGVIAIMRAQSPDQLTAAANAIKKGGVRVIEVTMTTPGVLEAIEAISSEFKNRLFVAAGTVLDPSTAREVILHGGSLIVSPAVNTEVIATANRYGVPVYSGAFTATECLTAIEAGATMVKVFPAQLGGPQYMTNLRMVFPQINLIPSGGISLDNAAEFIRCGACAVSGARTFMNPEKIAEEGLGWITVQVARYIKLIQEAKQNLPELP